VSFEKVVISVLAFLTWTLLIYSDLEQFLGLLNYFQVTTLFSSPFQDVKMALILFFSVAKQDVILSV
jgi:hypothetical protein